MTDECPLIVRARMMCEDGLFAKAHELIDKALNLDPHNADAYVVSLMAHHEATKEADLGAIPTDQLATHPDYVKATQFGDAELRQRLDKYVARACELAYLENETHLLRAFRIAQDRPLTEDRRSQLETYAKKRIEEKRRKAEEIAREKAAEARERDLKAKANKILNVDYHADGVRWEIIDVHPSEERVLVLAENLIAQRRWGGTTWRDSELRAWLNSVFLEALPPHIYTRIVAVDHSTRDETDQVIDSVFVPSESEFRGSRLSQAPYLGEEKDWASYSSERHWWVRGPGSAPKLAAAMDRNGRPVFTWGREYRDHFEKIYGVSTGTHLGVRPSFWLSVGEPNPMSVRHESPLVAEARRLCEEGKFRMEKSQRNVASRLNPEVAEGAAAVAVALDPNDVSAHIVALMADHLCPTEVDLGLLATTEMSNNSHYLTALRLGDEDLRLRLKRYDARAHKRARIVADIEKLVHDPAATADAEKALRDHQTQARLLSTKSEELASEVAELERKIKEAIQLRESLGIFSLRKRYEAASERDRLTEKHLTISRELEDTEARRSAYELQLAKMSHESQARRTIDSFQVREIDDISGLALVVATRSITTTPFDDNAGNADRNFALRAWLNTHFRRRLPDSVRGHLRPIVHRDGTVDHVFILSELETTARSCLDGAPLDGLGFKGSWRRPSADELSRPVRLDEIGRTRTWKSDPSPSVYPAMLVSFDSES